MEVSMVVKFLHFTPLLFGLALSVYGCGVDSKILSLSDLALFDEDRCGRIAQSLRDRFGDEVTIAYHDALVLKSYAVTSLTLNGGSAEFSVRKDERDCVTETTIFPEMEDSVFSQYLLKIGFTEPDSVGGTEIAPQSFFRRGDRLYEVFTAYRGPDSPTFKSISLFY